MGGVRVVVLALPAAQSLDVVGPVEVFDGAAQLVAARGSARPYELSVVAPGAGTVELSNGLALGVDALPGPRAAIDTLVVAGGAGARWAAAEDPAVRWL